MRLFVSVLLFVAVLSTSCTRESEICNLTRLMDEWKGRTVLMPDSLMDLLTEEDIIFDGDFTILHYVDSGACTGCKMHLPLWKEFVRRIDSISDYDTRIVTVVNTKNKEELWAELIRHQYSEPVYADIKGEMDSLNHFPSSSKLQTFLLDKAGRVVLIGDPLMSEEMAMLYISIVSGSVVYDQSFNSTLSVALSNKQWLDTIQLGELKECEFTLVNYGSDTVIIENIFPSCECISVEMSTNFIGPKDSVCVRLKKQEILYTGPFENKVMITLNSFDNPMILEVSGIVVR